MMMKLSPLNERWTLRLIIITPLAALAIMAVVITSFYIDKLDLDRNFLNTSKDNKYNTKLLKEMEEESIVLIFDSLYISYNCFINILEVVNNEDDILQLCSDLKSSTFQIEYINNKGIKATLFESIFELVECDSKNKIVELRFSNEIICI